MSKLMVPCIGKAWIIMKFASFKAASSQPKCFTFSHHSGSSGYQANATYAFAIFELFSYVDSIVTRSPHAV